MAEKAKEAARRRRNKTHPQEVQGPEVDLRQLRHPALIFDEAKPFAEQRPLQNSDWPIFRDVERGLQPLKGAH